MPSKRRAIVWFRQDLRLHDNEALAEALHHAYEVIPVFVFDERLFKGKTKYGFPKVGKHRARFIIESIQDLKRSLKKLGSELIIRVGKPEEELFNIAQKTKSSWIFCNRERTPEEVFVQDELESKLWSIGQELRFSRGKMLYHTGDLPFPIQHTPDTFSAFRKEVERYVAIREPLPSPQRPLNFLTVDIEQGEIPDLEDFGHENDEPDYRSGFVLRGGERAALRRLKYYLWDSNAVDKYKKTKDFLHGGDITSKLSPWLAQGCLSPKMIYAELKRYEAQNGESKSTYALFISLMYRDFLRFMVKKHGNSVFHKGGLLGDTDERLNDDYDRFADWVKADTGIDLVDASMNELNITGYLSAKARQNVASYLVHDLKVNWQMGAEYFESVLIDYDVCSNWANWNYLSGLGTDPKEEKNINIENQALRLDPNGDYIDLWHPKPETGKEIYDSSFH